MAIWNLKKLNPGRIYTHVKDPRNIFSDASSRNMADKVTLKHVGYWIEGTAYVTPWGGGDASIDMKPYKVNSLNKTELTRGVNDNGFGVESINSADLQIYDLYENGYKEYLKDMTIELTKKHQKIVKRGI